MLVLGVNKLVDSHCHFRWTIWSQYMTM